MSIEDRIAELEMRQAFQDDTIQALKTIAGGAMQTNNMGDVTPKFVILASTITGNHPFSHVVGSKGQRDEEVVFNFEGLVEVLKDYKDTFDGDVFIGCIIGAIIAIVVLSIIKPDKFN